MEKIEKTVSQLVSKLLETGEYNVVKGIIDPVEDPVAFEPEEPPQYMYEYKYVLTITT